MQSTDEFWKGSFGNEYQQRQKENAIGSVTANERYFESIFMDEIPNSILEYGAGTGQNLEAIHNLWPWIDLSAVEINTEAAKEISSKEIAHVYNVSVLSLHEHIPMAEMVLTKGFLIHIPPEKLEEVYRVLYNSSISRILLCEYYHPVPAEVEYRGHQGKLWKRDFAGEMMELFPDLNLIKYGFVYRGDEWYAQDDLTYFLLEKTF